MNHRRLIGIALLVLFSGCNSPLKLDKPWDAFSSLMDEKEETLDPDRILAIWSDTVLHRKGQPATRGFGGRIMLYTGVDPDPVKVDGALVVYAFDAKSNATVPEKKFVFPAETIPDLHSKSSLGHSYSVWLPWGRVGGETRHVSLVVRFEGTNGSVVVSKPARKLLPGTAAQIEAPIVTKSQSKVQQVTYQEPAAPTAATLPTDLQPANAAPVRATFNNVTYGSPGQTTVNQPHVLPNQVATGPRKLQSHTIELPADFANRNVNTVSNFAAQQALAAGQSAHLPTRSAAANPGSSALPTASLPLQASAPTQLELAAGQWMAGQRTSANQYTTAAQNTAPTQYSTAPAATLTPTAPPNNPPSASGSLHAEPLAPFATSARPSGPVWPSRPGPIARRYDRPSSR